MPEGHSIHRLAGAFTILRELGPVRASSPQGRFSDGAKLIDGLPIHKAWAWGKHLFLDFTEDGSRTLHVHLGLYGSWRFYMSADLGLPTHIGAPRQRGEHLADHVYIAGQTGRPHLPDDSAKLAYGIQRLLSNHGGGETPKPTSAISQENIAGEDWLPAPGENTRLRLLFTDRACADLSGPTKCELLNADEVAQILRRLGPDPLQNSPALKADFISRCKRLKRQIAQVVMDQSVIAGPGNIYRAECLYRCGIHPHRLAANISAKRLGLLWDDLVAQMTIGLADGKIITMPPEERQRRAAEIPDGDPNDSTTWPRYYVYQREGQPCWECGRPVSIELLAGRKNYWCNHCQH